MRKTLFLVCALAIACGTSGRSSDEVAPPANEPAPTTQMPPPAPPTAAPDASARDRDDGCTTGEAICLDHDRRRACVAKAWIEETCAAGSGCFQGACTPGKCSDECTAGA